MIDLKDLANKLGIKNVAHKITKDEYFIFTNEKEIYKMIIKYIIFILCKKKPYPNPKIK